MIVRAIDGHAVGRDVDGPPCYPSIRTVRIIYEETVDSIHPRGLFVQVYTNYGGSTSITDTSDDIPRDYLYDLSRSLLKKRTRPWVVSCTKQAKDYAIERRDLLEQELETVEKGSVSVKEALQAHISSFETKLKVSREAHEETCRPNSLSVAFANQRNGETGPIQKCLRCYTHVGDHKSKHT